MALFGKKDNSIKDNGINWQQEVFEIAKAIPKILEKQVNMGTGFNDHAAAGRKQRDEDKIWQAKILENSLACIKGKQIDDMQEVVDTLKTDKVTRDGKFLGIKSVYAVILAILGLPTLILGILWRLGFL